MWYWVVPQGSVRTLDKRWKGLTDVCNFFSGDVREKGGQILKVCELVVEG